MTDLKTIKIPEEAHTQAKTAASAKGESLVAFLIRAIQREAVRRK